MPKLIVTQDENKPMPIEVMAESIRSISEGIKKLRHGPLNERALLLLIQHSAAMVGAPLTRNRVGQSTIKAVLDGIEDLESTYLKPKKKK